MTETELLKYHKRVLTISHKSHIQYWPAFEHYISVLSICHQLKTVPLINPLTPEFSGCSAIQRAHCVATLVAIWLYKGLTAQPL